MCLSSLSVNNSSALVDLMGLNTLASGPEPSTLQSLTQNMAISLLDDELMSVGEHGTCTLSHTSVGHLNWIKMV